MFYIQPPKGLITLHTLEEVVLSRIEYLNLLDGNKNETFNGKFEYLFHGSSYDYIGHFILRLLTLKSDKILSYWISKETLLLKQRLAFIQSRQLYRLFKTILKHINRLENHENPVFNALKNICSFYLLPEAFRHITSKYHTEDCTDYHHKIDFALIPDLIETKSVDLFRGLATVYCSQWKELLQSLFQTFLSYEINKSELKQFFADPRLNFLFQKLQQYLFAKGYNREDITAASIDDVSFHFPPCMKHLHMELKQKHRLSHYARFYYTLFLKECGMSLEEALIYWRNEYSKSHNCITSCTHDWQTDAKKFNYSIRHMYGLEGGRKNYKCPNCQNISEIPGANYEGGCPFINFDLDSLKSLLSKIMTKNEFDEFMRITCKQNSQDACATFFQIKSAHKINNVTINRPVEYYMKMTELN